MHVNEIFEIALVRAFLGKLMGALKVFKGQYVFYIIASKVLATRSRDLPPSSQMLNITI